MQNNFLIIAVLGNVYIADAGNNRIRKVTVSTGIITTFAGTGSYTYSGDNGPATAAAFSCPIGVALDASGNHHFILIIIVFVTFLYFLYLGNVYIVDSSNKRIRKVTISTGIITTIAGSGSKKNDYDGENGPATSVVWGSIFGVALDTSGTCNYL